ILLVVGVCLALGLTNRLWLCTALLIADLTLTDYAVPFTGGLSLRTILTAAVALAMGLAVLQRRVAFNRPLVPIIAALAVLAAIGTLSNVVNGTTTSTFLFRSLTGILIIVILVGMVRGLRDLAIVFIPTLLVMILSAFTAVAQAYLHVGTVYVDPTFLAQYAGRSFGLAQTPIALGNDLVIAAAVLAGMLLHMKWPRLAVIAGWVGVGVLLFGAYETGSRSIFVAAAAAAAVLFVSLYSRIPRPVFFLVLILGAVVTVAALPKVINGSGVTTRASSDLSDSSATRLVLWTAGVLIVRDHPLLGIGYGQFQSVAPTYRAQVIRLLGGPTHADEALGTLPVHNDFLMMWVSFGVVGFLAFLAMHLLAAWSLWRAWRSTQVRWLRALIAGCAAALAAYAVHESFHNGFEDSLIVWFILGAAVMLNWMAGEMKRQVEGSQTPTPLFASVPPVSLSPTAPATVESAHISRISRAVTLRLKAGRAAPISRKKEPRPRRQQAPDRQ
ncbi:MAG TPA: O-antigen ligase family protein, partial [Ktedonobacterales bacterium]|nr:O-antigen ligase family protein [Ktedonobacterales bacterium]